MSTSQASGPRPEIRRDVDNIPLNLLNSEYNKFIKAHERSEALEGKSVGLSVPEYIDRRGKGKFLS